MFRTMQNFQNYNVQLIFLEFFKCCSIFLYLKYILFDEVKKGFGHENKQKKNTLIDTICIIYFMKTVRDELNYDLYLYLENKYHVEKKDNYV